MFFLLTKSSLNKWFIFFYFSQINFFWIHIPKLTHTTLKDRKLSNFFGVIKWSGAGQHRPLHHYV